jgi:hypothetical protein
MGASHSPAHGGEPLSKNPLLFGAPGEVGILLGVFHDHNLTTPRVAAHERRDNIIAVSREFIDVYNQNGACPHSRAQYVLRMCDCSRVWGHVTPCSRGHPCVWLWLFRRPACSSAAAEHDDVLRVRAAVVHGPHAHLWH